MTSTLRHGSIDEIDIDMVMTGNKVRHFVTHYVAIPDNPSVNPLWRVINNLFRQRITAGLGTGPGCSKAD